MRIISTNIATPKQITYRGRTETTGIYKIPSENGISLDFEDVKNDEVTDRKHHGGIYKACYLFSQNHYRYWKSLYPDLEWQYGMFGENLTVGEMDDSQLYIGSIYEAGDTQLQITTPREPCYKLGVKFGNQRIIEQFVAHGYPGTYVRVLKTGKIAPGDTFNLIEQAENSLTTTQFFQLLYSQNKNIEHLERALKNEAVPPKKRLELQKYLKK